MTNGCGAGTIDALNDVPPSKANDARVAKTGQVRADTTVVPATVKYPTDSRYSSARSR